MKNAFTEETFLENREMIISKIGLYVSRSVVNVYEQNQYIIVIYKTEFENEEVVDVRLVFIEQEGKNLITGLWFNSSKLRE